MSKTVLLVTLVLELLLAGTRFIASSLKKKDRYGSEREQLSLPGFLRSDIDKVRKAPKIKNLRSGDV